MSLNYTPLDLNKFSQNEKITFYLLILATIMAGILATLLFILIQKKIQARVDDSMLLTPTTTITSSQVPKNTPVFNPTLTIGKEFEPIPSSFTIMPNEVNESTKITTESAE